VIPGYAGGMTEPQRTHRVVRSDDPTLTPEANRLLTEELREIVGADEVDVPTSRVEHEHDRHGTHSRWGAALASNRVILIVGFAMAVVVGAILALATGKWWVILIPLAVHAVGTFFVAGLALQATTEMEHPAPTVAARLEEEGVADPDRVLTDLAAEFSPDADEQRTELTPSHRSEPVAEDDGPIAHDE
jgi:hypothetical protein